MLEGQYVGKVRCGRSSGRAAALAVGAAVVLALALAAPAVAGSGPTTRVSLTNAGARAGNTSFGASLSADGSLVAFQSDATDLVPGDTNGFADVFVRNRTTGTTTRVSVPSSGGEANQRNGESAISGDGRYVAFTSTATNLDTPATTGVSNVYVHDRTTGTTTRVSRTPAPAPADPPDGPSGGPLSISRDGRYVAFASDAALVSNDTNFSTDVFVYDTTSHTTERVSVTNNGSEGIDGNGSFAASISADGRYVAFISFSQLVPADTNSVDDVYVRDRTNGTTTLASVARDGTAGDAASSPSGVLALSADGRHVAFGSDATNLVAGDANGKTDVFVRDLDAAKTVRASVASDGSAGNDGSGSFDSAVVALSGDGRRVAFASNATNLVAGDTNGKTDVFVRDRDADANGTFDEAGTGNTATTRESVSPGGFEGDDVSGGIVQAAFGQAPAGVSLTEDGTGLAFGSTATNLVAGDTNMVPDVFFRRLTGPGPQTLTVAKAGAGQGTVTSSPAGIDCGSSCSHAFDSGTSVTLTATPATGSTFTGFSGAGCAGAATTCTVTLDAARSVTATFAVPQTLTVAKAGAGQGTVTSSPAGIDCGASCSHAFDSGTSVTLTATPATGSTFTGFSGAGCAGAATTCTVTLDAARSVTATFAVAPAGGGGGNPPPGGGGSPPPAGGGAVRDTTPPGVSSVGLTNNPFVVGGSTPTFGVAAKAKKHKKGTTLRYTLSEAATVKIVISQSRSGRRQGKRCVAPTRKLRKAKKCTRISVKGTLTRTSHQGSNRVAFSGRIGSKALAPGRYQATITATDPAKNTSTPKTIAFTIVKR